MESQTESQPRAGWSVRVWCASASLSTATYYALPEGIRPASVKVGKRRIVIEQPKDWLRRLYAAGELPRIPVYNETGVDVELVFRDETAPGVARHSISLRRNTAMTAHAKDWREADLQEKVDAYVQTCPPKSRQLVARALTGRSRSPRDAIKAKCLSCSSSVRDEAAACTVWIRPLWAINPYRKIAIKHVRADA